MSLSSGSKNQLLGSQLEHGLLLLCARTQLTEPQIGRLNELCRENVDWQVLTSLAERHGVCPLLYRTLSRHAGSLVPPEISEALKRRFTHNTARNLALTAELHSLSALMGGQGIRAIPFKGPLLASEAYGNLGYREFKDLDLFVPKARALEAIKLLSTTGYTLTRGEADNLKGYHRCFVYPDKKITVELHWDVVLEDFGVPLDMAALFQNHETITLAGKPVSTFRPEQILLLLTIHGSKHLWQGLSWIVDVAEYLRAKPDLNLAKVLDEAGKIGARRMALLGLKLSRDLLQAPVPNQINEYINKEPALEEIAGIIGAQLLWRGQNPGLLKTYWLLIGMRERPRDRLRLLKRLARLVSKSFMERFGQM